MAQKKMVSVQKPVDKPLLSITGGRSGKASKDNRYIFLIEEWSKNPNLTEQKMAALIQANHFDRNYGITVADVVADIKAYKANPSSVTKTNSGQQFRNKEAATVSLVVKTYSNRDEYIDGLTKYSEKYKDSSFLDGNIEKFVKVCGIKFSTNNILSIRMDLLQLQMGKKPNSPLFLSYAEATKAESGFRKAFSERIFQYLYLANESWKFRGVLLDLLPEYKREVNMLIQLLSIGIVDDLQREKKADTFLINRYIKRMSDNYGYDEVLIAEIVNVWCDEYLSYLNKKQ
jgi:hypothetical protein